jgi:outer membrane protein assembly factor BamE (lipoprotein component of BamABCDE complex)
MRRINKILAIALIPSLFIQSCIVSAPKYTHVEQVMQLKTGMSMDSVNSKLGIEPYDIDVYDSTGYRSYIYKYRTTDRKTIPFFLKETNGKKKIGKYMDLVAYFDSTNIAYKFESRSTDSKVDQKKFNINVLVTIVTVVVPSLLVYLGIQKTN